jgi:deazaflavin-dependent oxidoreductase (nitroreductase family)
MLEHTGRQSGQTRRTVLEVVANHPDAVYVASGWGSSAQWLKNVRADPRVVFYLGSRRYQTVAEMVTEEGALSVMRQYAARHGRALERLAGLMLDDPGQTGEEQAERVAETVPMVRLPK